MTHRLMATARHRTCKKNRSYTIGIITIPHSLKIKYGSSHIMKSYVDWFERRGIHVIPIPYDTKHHHRIKIQQYLNCNLGIIDLLIL